MYASLLTATLSVPSHATAFPTASSSSLVVAITRSPVLANRLRHARTGDLVIATTSEDDEAVGKAVAWLGTDNVAVSSDAYIYRHSLDPKYVAYFFQSEQFQ